MSRAARLLAMLEALRGRRRPVAASRLAADLGVSVRTVYRDIATLAAQGVPIAGEAGLGYVLGPGHVLPPLMLEAEEADAVVLGLRLVTRRGDPALAAAAERAIAKIAAVLPSPLKDATDANGLLAGPRGQPEAPALSPIRQALRAETKLRLRYVDRHGVPSARVVWPIAVGFFDAADVLAAWCETRMDFRHFRLDRIAAAIPLSERPPRRRPILLAEWWSAQRFDEPRQGTSRVVPSC